jgi:hypothetical protein
VYKDCFSSPPGEAQRNSPATSNPFSDRTLQGERLWTFTFKKPSARTERKKGVYRGLELEAEVRLPSCSRPSRPGTGFDIAEHGPLQLRIRLLCDGEYIEQDPAEIMFQYGCPRFAWASAYGVKDWRFPCGWFRGVKQLRVLPGLCQPVSG